MHLQDGFSPVGLSWRRSETKITSTLSNLPQAGSSSELIQSTPKEFLISLVEMPRTRVVDRSLQIEAVYDPGRREGRTATLGACLIEIRIRFVAGDVTTP
jgi:hypothetical protein